MKDYKNTNEENLNQAKKIGEDIGLKYVYATENNTYCPNCNSLVIKRNLYKIKRMDDKGRCPQCNQKIF
jgi:pyruvate formate lyase activating enzyme